MPKPKYTFKSNTILHTHKRMQLSEDTVVLPDGTETGYLRYDNLPDSATLIVINHEGELLLLNEYTYPTDDYIYQMPGGVLDAGEQPLDAAKRELLEETGLTAKNYELLGTVLQDHRRSKAVLNLFLVTELAQTEHQREVHEFMELEWLTEDEMRQKVESGQVLHYGTLVAWSYYINKYRFTQK